MPNQACPTDDRLLAFSLGKLSELAENDLVEHLDACPRCETAVAVLDDTSDDVIRGLRGPQRPDEYADETQFNAALARVKAIGKELSSSDQDLVKSAERTGKAEAPDELDELRDYRLLEKIGEGGMGAVYKAMHTKLEKIVALKVLPTERMRDEEAVGRFHREMKAVGRLEHANIVQASDAGEADGRHFLVMEYVKGIDLAALMEQVGELPVAEACELIRQAAVGLQFVHENGMVHRDIKPSNVMVTADGQVKLLDLGLALLQDQPTEASSEAITLPSAAASELTSVGQLMGTLDYMAPEQCDDSHQVDIRADIYSLGATLYKLLVGAAPFGDTHYNTPIKKMMALATDTATPVGTRRQDVPAALSALISRMLAKNPEHRYETPAEVATALGQFAESSDLPGWLGAELKDTLPAPSPDNLLGVGALDPTDTGVKTVDEFDPYYRWLAIPPDEQPPHHYRLLGVKEFERYADVIAVAADRQMSHIRTFQSGKYSKESQKLLNEISAAKLCLLNEAKKEAYDQRLKKQLAEKSRPKPKIAAAHPPPPPKANRPAPATTDQKSVQPEPPSVSAFQFAKADAQRETQRKVRRRARPVWQPLALVGAIAALVLIGAFFLLPRLQETALTDDPPVADVPEHALNSGDEPAKLDGRQAVSADPLSLETPPAIRLESTSPPPTGTTPAIERPATPAVVVPAPVVRPAPTTKPPVRRGARFRSMTELKSLSVSNERQFCVAWSPNGQLIATAGGFDARDKNGNLRGNDFVIRLWNARDFSKAGHLPGHTGSVTSIAFSPDSKLLASASADGTTRLWNADGQKWKVDLAGDYPAVAFSPDGTRLAMGGGDPSRNHAGFLFVVDVADGRVLTKSQPSEVICLAYAPDGKTIACGTYTRGIISLWDPNTGARLGNLPGHKDATTALAFSPDSKTLASGSYQRRDKNNPTAGSVKLWDIASQREIATLADGLKTVRSTAFSPDGGTLAVGVHDGRLLMFDVAERKQIASQKKSSNQIYSAAFSPDGRRLATVGHGQAMYIWDIAYDEPPPSTAPTAEPTPPVTIVRHPKPSASQQEAALRIIHEAFAGDYAKANQDGPEAKVSLARTLLSNINEDPEHATERYSLLNEARRLAVEAGDPKLAMEVVESIVDRYDLEAWSARRATIKAVAKQVRDSRSKSALVEVCLQLAEVAFEEDRLDEAEVVSRIASAQNVSASVKSQANVVKNRLEQLKPQWDAAQAAREKLASHKDDPDANLQLGKYLCFSHGEWQKGLPHLAKGSDDQLKAVAQQELSAPASPEEQFEIAEGWYALFKKLRSEPKNQKDNVIAHCEHWYGQALPQLTGIAKLKATKRLEEIDRLAGRQTAPGSNRQLAALLQQAILLMNFEPKNLGVKDGRQMVRGLTGIWGEVKGAVPCPGIGGALKFNGKGQCVHVDDVGERIRSGLRALTISVWAKSNDRRGTAFLFDMGYYAPKGLCIVQYRDHITFQLPKDLRVTVPFSQGRWHHIVGVWNGKAMALYVDGVLSDQRATPPLILNKETVADEAPRIGTQAKADRADQRSFNGAIDELAIFPMAISPQQVKLLYDAGQNGQPLGVQKTRSKRPERTKRTRPAQPLVAMRAADMTREHSPIENDWAKMTRPESIASTRVSFPKTGRYLFRIRAYGEQGGDEAVKMSLNVDGKPAFLFDVAATKKAPQVYQTELNITQGVRNIKIHFHNDKRSASAGWDRNLLIQFLEIYPE